MRQRGRKAPASLAIVPPDPPADPPRHGDVPAPAHLSAQASAFWRSTVAEFELAAHHLLLLQAACEQMDVITAAREALAVNGGLTITDPQGRMQQHPGVVAQRNSTVLLARLIRELDLDASDSFAAFDRPPPLRSNRN